MTAQDVREILEGLPCPICTKGVSDDDLDKLITDVDFELYNRFGSSDTSSNDKIDCAWWEVLERTAINDYGMIYYEDIEYTYEQ